MDFSKFSGFNFEEINKISQPILQSPFDPKYKNAEEVMEEIEQDFDEEEVDFSDSVCKICGAKVDDDFSWYYMKHLEDGENISICSYECLKQFSGQVNQTIDDYEIVEYTRCAAYYKCMELGNLRRMCQRKESLTFKSIVPVIHNFCETAQAGIILASHKSYEVLNEFSKSTNSQLTNFKELMNEFSQESSKQYKITTKMTVLVIILTIINIAIAAITYFDNSISNTLYTMNNNLTSVSEKIKNEDIFNELENIHKEIDDINKDNSKEILKKIDDLKNTIIELSK